MAQPRPAIRFAIRASWSVIPTLASTTKMPHRLFRESAPSSGASVFHESVSSTLASQPCGIDQDIFHTVALEENINRISRSARMSETTTRSSPSKRFTSVLLPTLGRPTKAI